MDRYRRLIEALFYLRAKGVSSHALHNTLGKPGCHYPTVHIAGTNGKGSVAIKMASALQEGGYRVGLYTSPHIDSFRERVQINEEKISRESVVFYLEFLQKILGEQWESCNFFEITTMLAFLYFRDQGVDIAVIETGIGGRFDPTNVIIPLVSVITTISKDHEAELGNTFNAIAYQKAGIIKEKVPVVVGHRAIYPSVLEEAALKNAPIIFVPPPDSESYSVENQNIAKEALKILSKKFNLTEQAIDQGLKKEQPCRFECVQLAKHPLFIFDVAHNIDGFIRLTKRLQESYPDHNYHLLFGISKDKEYAECIQCITEMAKTIHLVTPAYGRGLEANKLKEAFEAISYRHVTAYATLEETMKNLLENLDSSQDIVVVCGTFYIMQTVRDWLNYVS
jgi:dihydrofolate synthase/folylpolyglutamate synthase